jgi:phenylacetate-coenzyme A ligase PaaK-like adenylate-forming protein
MDGRRADVVLPDPRALLRERVVAAVNSVDFYRDLYGPYGQPPYDLQQFIRWFSLLPVISRATFEDLPIEFRMSKAYAGLPLVKKQTSGSHGIPLTIYIDERVARFRSWRFCRPHFSSGETSLRTLELIFPERFLVGARAAQLSDSSPRKKKKRRNTTDALKSPQLIYQELASKKPVTLIGYASAIVRLSEWMGQKRSLPSVKQIWTTSEMLTPTGREAIRHAFGFIAKEAYACGEFGFMGWQGTDDGSFTLETDRLIFQKASFGPNEPSGANDACRVVVSDLLNDVTPLLRYDIDDLATMASPSAYSSECYESLRELRGKVTDVVYNVEGERIEPFALLRCLQDTIGSAQFRLVCLDRSLFVLQYRPGKSLPVQVEAALTGLREIVGAPIAVVAQKVSAIARERSGKLRPIVNLSTMHGNERSKVLEELHLADFTPRLASCANELRGE